LRKTIYDLAEEHPRVRSVAVVPLGLTRYNTDPRLTPVTSEFCLRTVREVGAMQKDLRARLGTNFAFLGDEIYLRAGLAVPSRRHYGDYPQIEDGVGMVRSFKDEFTRLLKRLERKPPRCPSSLHATVLTGKLFAPVLAPMLDDLNERFGTRLKTVAVENDYFGPDIVVTGLMTGRDVLASRDQIEGEFVILPSAALKSDEPVMLDGTALPDLERKLGLPVQVHDMTSFRRLVSER
jgi:NifB/MoaA-like Fe-S oxidoreductase